MPHQAQFIAPLPEAPAVGIAALAQAAEGAEERNAVHYAWLNCRSILNWSDGARAHFEWSINPYRGCEFGCPYCFARSLHTYMELRDPFDFERKVFMKRSAAEILRRDLMRGRAKAGEAIVFGAATEPYQPAEKRFGLTRALLEVLLGFEGFRIGFITKSDLITRDIGLLQKIARRHSLRVSMTVTTTDAGLARITEPRAPTPQRRLKALAKLREAGIHAGVNIMPIIPMINDSEEQMEDVAREAAGVGADFLAENILFLSPSSWGRWRIFLAEHFPQLQGLYDRWYGQSMDAPETYRREVPGRAAALRKKSQGWRGMGDGDGEGAAPMTHAQPGLFE